jgi:hypothetical protein
VRRFDPAGECCSLKPMKKPNKDGDPAANATVPVRKDVVPPPKPQEPTVTHDLPQIPWGPATPPAKLPFKI